MIPLLWFGASAVDCPVEMHPEPAQQDSNRTLHLVPRGSEWRLMREGDDQPLAVFGDLGRALDAATRGHQPVRVVVHEPGAA